MRPILCTQYDLMLLEAAVKVANGAEPLSAQQWDLACRIGRGLVAIQQPIESETPPSYSLYLTSDEVRGLIRWIDSFRIIAPSNPIGLICLTKLYDAVYEEQDERQLPETKEKLPKGVEEAFDENGRKDHEDANADDATGRAGHNS